MYEYDEECLKTFLKKQGQLFDEPVAETLEEAEAFLEDCMAVIADSLDEVKSYLEEEGMDIDGMSADEIEDATERNMKSLSYSLAEAFFSASPMAPKIS